MDFNALNNLSFEELEKEYNDIIEGVDYISACTAGDVTQYLEAYIECSDGRKGTVSITGQPCNVCGGDMAYTVDSNIYLFGYCDKYNDLQLVYQMCGCNTRPRYRATACIAR